MPENEPQTEIGAAESLVLNADSATPESTQQLNAAT